MTCTRCVWTANGGISGGWCPCCDRWAHDQPHPAGEHEVVATTRCVACGAREQAVLRARAGVVDRPRACACGGHREIVTATPWIDVADGVDALFGLPFFLSTPCAGHTLWVANRAHLDYLESFISARIRPRGRIHLGSRLPRWMLDAKHRDAVLRGLATLRGRLDELTGPGE